MADDLRRLHARQRTEILDHIEVQLRHAATRPARNRKVIVGLMPPWRYAEPIWELRVGEYRVFYDVDEEDSIVFVRAIRHKPPHKRTEDIL